MKVTIQPECTRSGKAPTREYAYRTLRLVYTKPTQSTGQLRESEPEDFPAATVSSGPRGTDAHCLYISPKGNSHQPNSAKPKSTNSISLSSAACVCSLSLRGRSCLNRTRRIGPSSTRCSPLLMTCLYMCLLPLPSPALALQTRRHGRH